MAASSSYILWLPSWYPNELSPFNGDFIQRHAQAAASYNDIHVIYAVPDEDGIITKGVKEEFIRNGRLTEHIIYFKKSATAFGRIKSFLKWKRLLKKAIKKHIHENGKPAIVHIHILIRAGMIAKWIKKKWGISYVLSEQWGGYLPESDNKFSDTPFYIQLYWRKIIRGAISLSVVSVYLGECLKQISPQIHYTVIPNVVDTTIFMPVDLPKNEITRFIHISLLNYQKNAEDIIKAFGILKKTEPRFRLEIFGPENDGLVSLANELNLQEEIKFHPEIPQKELAKFVQQSDALILYSRYETFGCVIIEALACGKPVILSDLPVMHENAKEGFNAVFAEKESPGDLAAKLNWFIHNRDHFDSMEIARQAALAYNYEKVGKQFSDWYKKTLKL